MPRINQLPAASSVAQTDVLAIDTTDKTYKVPRSVLAPAPYIATIPTGQWSGSGSDRYITVTASNVTADAMLYPFYDNASAALLNGPVWVIPAAGSFTIHTSAIPSGTVTISVLLAGIVGEAQYQVLADVYSKSQVDTIVSQSTAYVDCGTVTGSGITDAIGAAWDAIATYDKTVVGKFTYQGQWMYIAYKYTGSQYGVMIAVKYNSTPYLMRVTSGAKTYFTFGITQVT
jgi:hypothetical protein